MYHYRASTIQASFLPMSLILGLLRISKGCLYHAHTRDSCCSSAIATRVPLDRESSFFLSKYTAIGKDCLIFCVTCNNLFGCNIMQFHRSLHCIQSMNSYEGRNSPIVVVQWWVVVWAWYYTMKVVVMVHHNQPTPTIIFHSHMSRANPLDVIGGGVGLLRCNLSLVPSLGFKRNQSDIILVHFRLWC